MQTNLDMANLPNCYQHLGFGFECQTSANNDPKVLLIRSNTNTFHLRCSGNYNSYKLKRSWRIAELTGDVTWIVWSSVLWAGPEVVSWSVPPRETSAAQWQPEWCAPLVDPAAKPQTTGHRILLSRSVPPETSITSKTKNLLVCCISSLANFHWKIETIIWGKTH